MLWPVAKVAMRLFRQVGGLKFGHRGPGLIGSHSKLCMARSAFVLDIHCRYADMTLVLYISLYTDLSILLLMCLVKHLSPQ